MKPQPIWSNAPRHCPRKSLPPYAYVPGQNPHPLRHPQGHSFYKPYGPQALPVADWRKHPAYLYGVDLYHQSFFWEAHEVWEALWKMATKNSPEHLFYQTLILNTAALLKIRQEEFAGVRKHSLKSQAKLAALIEMVNQNTFQGLHLSRFQTDLTRFYGPLWKNQKIKLALDQDPPRLNLNF